MLVVEKPIFCLQFTPLHIFKNSRFQKKKNPSTIYHFASLTKYLFLCFSGNLELSEKCFQELILRDQNHPAALINYSALLLCKHGSFIAGMLSAVKLCWFCHFRRKNCSKKKKIRPLWLAHTNKSTGAGAAAGDYASVEKITAVSVAKECLLASLKADPRAAHIWANLANAYYIIGDHKSSSKCLEKVLIFYCFIFYLLVKSVFVCITRIITRIL